MPSLNSWKDVRGRGKMAVAKMARRVLPKTTIRLSHVEPGLTLTVNLRRHVMFWSQGLVRFEPSTVAVLRAAIRPGDSVFDIGANIGFFSTLFARWVEERGRVLAVEPEPENLVLLRENLEMNGGSAVTVCDVAVGASNGIAQFSLDEATGATGHLGCTPTAGETAVGTGKVEYVATRVETIDSLVEAHKIVPDVVKMDIEGGEIEALEGAEKLLADHRPVVVSELTGIAGLEVVGRLSQSGYQLWDLETSRRVGPDDRPFMVVAIPAERIDSDRARRILEALGASD